MFCPFSILHGYFWDENSYLKGSKKKSLGYDVCRGLNTEDWNVEVHKKWRKAQFSASSFSLLKVYFSFSLLLS